MVDECSGRGGRQAVALPAEITRGRKGDKKEATGDGNARHAAGMIGEAGHV